MSNLLFPSIIPSISLKVLLFLGGRDDVGVRPQVLHGFIGRSSTKWRSGCTKWEPKRTLETKLLLKIRVWGITYSFPIKGPELGRLSVADLAQAACAVGYQSLGIPLQCCQDWTCPSERFMLGSRGHPSPYNKTPGIQPSWGGYFKATSSVRPDACRRGREMFSTTGLKAQVLAQSPCWLWAAPASTSPSLWTLFERAWLAHTHTQSPNIHSVLWEKEPRCSRWATSWCQKLLTAQLQPTQPDGTFVFQYVFWWGTWKPLTVLPLVGCDVAGNAGATGALWALQVSLVSPKMPAWSASQIRSSGT